MKIKTLLLVLPLLLASAALFSEDKKMTPDERTWLEDVSPIISRTERDVFLSLRTSAERAKFIAFFWRMRDATPDTSENEFKQEYMERVRFADKIFGHDSPKRGSQTERGFYYLLLGKPLERTLYTTNSEVWPCELWFYKGEEEFGLPPYFYLIFYQPQGIGDYRLYYPGIEGPEKLAIPQGTIDTSQRSTALSQVKKVSSELASASRSYLPEDRVSGSSSLSSTSLIASIKQFPEKKYSDSYARSYLAYKDFIEVEYADKYLDSAFQVKVLKAAGQPFLFWSIEPEKMNFASDRNAIYAGFELVVRLEDGRGRPVYETTQEIPLKLTADQYKAHERQRFAFQDLLPVIPGAAKALFLLKNRTAKDFSSFEVRLAVPGDGQAGLSVPLLFHAREAVAEAQKAGLKAFALDGVQYLIGARNEFMPAEKLGVYVQGWHLDKLKLAERPSYVLEIIALDGGRSLGRFPLADPAPAASDAATLCLTGEFSLAAVAPGYYRAEVSVLEPSGRKVLTEKENFIVLAKPFPVLPWVYSRLQAPFPGPAHLRTIGTEYFLAGDYEQARRVLERALETRDDPAARLLLAKALFGLGRHADSLRQALPLSEKTPSPDAAKVIALDYAGLKDWTSALTYLEKLMAEATEVSVLNLAAECHMNLGRPDKALPLIEKSLSLVPDQPALKELEARAKKDLGRK